MSATDLDDLCLRSGHRSRHDVGRRVLQCLHPANTAMISQNVGIVSEFVSKPCKITQNNTFSEFEEKIPTN